MCVSSMQEPVTVELGSTYCYKRSGSKRSLVEKMESFQYIPRRESAVGFAEYRCVPRGKCTFNVAAYM